MLQRRFISLFFLLVAGIALHGQTNVTGKLTAGDEMASGVSVVVHPPGQFNAIVAFAFSDDGGCFKLGFESALDTVALTFRSMNYADTTLLVKNCSQTIELQLKEQVRQLTEVSVTGQPILAKGDTTIYRVGAFASEKDQSIGDVIARMPGFEVSDDGRIYFQGKQIQKYYIEGLDMLENNYNVANKNLPHQAVQSVEVMQNHQPIKMLRNRMHSNETSLNLRLQKNIAVTGSAYLGGGGPDLLRTAGAVPMFFSKEQQAIVSLQTNNVGSDLALQNDPIELKDGRLDGLSLQKIEMATLPSNVPEAVSKERFLFNDAYFFSVNHLRKLKNESTFKTNLRYFNDKVREQSLSESVYFFDGYNLLLADTTQSRKSRNSLIGDFILEKNDSDLFLKNKFSVRKYWDDADGSAYGVVGYQQRARTPFFVVSNELDFYKPTGKNFTRQFLSVNYNSGRQSLSIAPGVFPDIVNNGMTYLEANQMYDNQNFNVNGNSQFSLKLKQFWLDTEVGASFAQNWLHTWIVDDTRHELGTDSLTNHLSRFSGKVYLSESFRFERKKLKASFKWPVSLVNYSVKDPVLSVDVNETKLTVSPSCNVVYSINAYCSFSGSANFYTPDASIYNVSRGYVIADYRRLSQEAGVLQHRQVWRNQLVYRYKNPASGLFFHVIAGRADSYSNTMSSKEYLSDGVFGVTVVEKNNHSIMHNVDLQVSYYLTSLQSTVGLTAGFNSNTRQYVWNGALGRADNQVFSLSPNLSVNKWKSVQVDYKFDWSHASQSYFDGRAFNDGYKHNATLYLFPVEHQWVSFGAEYFTLTKQEDYQAHALFANAAYNVSFPKSRTSFQLKASNLFDVKRVTYISQTEISQLQNSYGVRPREFVAVFRFAL